MKILTYRSSANGAIIRGSFYKQGSYGSGRPSYMWKVTQLWAIWFIIRPWLNGWDFLSMLSKEPFIYVLLNNISCNNGFLWYFVTLKSVWMNDRITNDDLAGVKGDKNGYSRLEFFISYNERNLRGHSDKYFICIGTGFLKICLGLIFKDTY